MDAEFVAHDIRTNCRQYLKDAAPAANKDFDAVCGSVKQACLARDVARFQAHFVFKEAVQSNSEAA